MRKIIIMVSILSLVAMAWAQTDNKERDNHGKRLSITIDTNKEVYEVGESIQLKIIPGVLKADLEIKKGNNLFKRLGLGPWASVGQHVSASVPLHDTGTYHLTVTTEGSVSNTATVTFVNSQAAPQTYSVKRVLGCNTLELPDGELIELIGLQCPVDPIFPGEGRRTHMSRDATEFVAHMIEDYPIRLEFDVNKRSEHGRLLAYVYLLEKAKYWQPFPLPYVVDKNHKRLLHFDDVLKENAEPALFLNAVIIQYGYAQPSPSAPNEKYAGLFDELYQEAREQQRGVWQIHVEQTYCEEDADCILAEVCCGGRIPMNRDYYGENKDSLLAPCATRTCGGGQIYRNPRCVYNTCVGDPLTREEMLEYWGRGGEKR